MKKVSLVYLSLVMFAFQSCGEDDTSQIDVPSCNAKILTLSTPSNQISSSSSILESVSYAVAPNFSMSNFTVNPLSNTSFSGGFSFPEQTRNGVTDEYATLVIDAPNSKKLIKYNKATNAITSQSVDFSLSKPFYINGNLRFLKFSNFHDFGQYSYDPFGPTRTEQYDVQVMDENAIPISPIFTILLDENDGFANSGNTTPVVSGNKVYFMGSAYIVAIDLANNTFVKKNLYPFHYYNYRTFNSGLVKNGLNLYFLKHIVDDAGIPKIELQKIDLNNFENSSASTYSPSTIFKMQDATYNGDVAPDLSLITNRIETNLECMNYCRTLYYLEVHGNGTTGDDSKVYEFKLDSTTNYEVNVFTIPNRYFMLFDIQD
jgi:hypothetical protein